MCSPALRRVRRRRSWRRCSRPLPVLSGRCIILAADQPVESGAQREHPQYTKPELVATAPNQTPGTSVGADQVDDLYVVSTSSIGWGRRPGELGAGASHRRGQTGRPAPGAHPALRPRRADDEQVHRTTARRPRRDVTEPPSGARQPLLRQFKTLKYHPGFPGRFHVICRTFFPWEHRHGGIAMLRPSQSNPERLDPSSRLTRERFVRGIPQPIPFPKPSGPVIPTTKLLRSSLSR